LMAKKIWRMTMKIDMILEYYNQDNDEYNLIEIDHKRRPRLTLKHLQKLRRIRSIENFEHSERVKYAARMYGRSENQ
jgi:hypothetical protein